MTEAEQRLREVFTRHPARAVDGCPCCVSDDDRAGLAAGSLDALQLVARLPDPRTVAVLEEAFFTASDEDTAARYSRAVDEVAWLPEP